MIYAYAICDGRPTLSGGLRGMEDEPLQATNCDGVAAVFSEIRSTSLPPTPQSVWRHEQVIESLMPEWAVLPVRFGTVLPHPAALDDLLSRNRERLAAALDHVRNCVELGVRATAPTAADVAPAVPLTSGRDYRLAKLHRQRARDTVEAAAGELADRVHARLSAVAADATFFAAAPNFLMTGAYLVPLDSVETFRQAVNDVGNSEPGLRLLCTGPWPPYHFVPELQLPEVPRA